MEEFLRHYGLWALYLGMWIEGETVLVLAGFLIHQDFMESWLAYPVALFGALSVDSVVFGAGRWSHGSRLLHGLIGRSGAAAKERHLGWPAFFGVRFLYGTRTPYLFYAGTRGLSWPNFFAKDVAAAALWALIWLSCGDLLGRLLVLAQGELEHHERLLMAAGIVAAGSVLCGFIGWRARRRKTRVAASDGACEDQPVKTNLDGHPTGPYIK